MKTKDRIIDAALKLFNERGTKAVSTNHIASSAGISPGNLYYHFRNKEEIIRAIYLRTASLIDSGSSFGSGFTVTPSLAGVEAVFTRIMELHWRYRFLYREFNALLNRDPVLKGIINKNHTRWLKQIRASIRAFVREGIFRPMDRRTVLFLSRSLWIMGNYWHSFLEASGEKVTLARIREGISMMRMLLHPYMRLHARER